MSGNNKKDSFFDAFKMVFSAAAFVKNNKGMGKFFIIPFVLNIVLLSSILYLSWVYALPAVTGLLAGDAWYMKLLSIIAGPLFMILLVLGTIIVYSAAGGIVSAPFLDLLSEKTEKCAGLERDAGPFSPAALIGDIYRALVNTVKLLFLLLAVNLLLLIILLIPGGSFIYTVTGFLTSIFFYGFQFYDFPLERSKLKFGAKLKTSLKYRRSVAGTGAAFFLLSFIPVIGFLGLNLATVGAALTYVEKIHGERS